MEKESGKSDKNRPELRSAIRHCRATGSILLVAKLDRLSRNVAFLAALMESDIPFVCCDNPHATPFTLHIMAAMAQYERELISTRTKAALAQVKIRGKKPGSKNPHLGLGAQPGDMRVARLATEAGYASWEKRREAHLERTKAMREDGRLLPVEDRFSWEALTEALNRRGHRTTRGNPLSVAVVKRAFSHMLPCGRVIKSSRNRRDAILEALRTS